MQEATARHVAALGTLALLFLYSAPARADIWGYVDADRMPHFASSRLDDRYELLLRDSETVEPFKRVGGVPPVADGSLPPSDAQPVAKSALVGNAVPPKLIAFFDRSENYRTVSPLLRQASKTHGIDYSLLKALIVTESGFNPYAVSPKGAVGLMQLIPPTAERYGVTAGKDISIEKKLTDPKVNIKAGARYLADLIKMFPGRLELALAAYNAGEGAVQRAGNKIPNYPETQNYVKNVMLLYTGLEASPARTPVVQTRAEAKTGTKARNSALHSGPTAALSR
ncbi:MAG: lytic transglycosylase [Polaromonas sp.]|nr:lytic transglycosylase [Polaromonas sp.]